MSTNELNEKPMTLRTFSYTFIVFLMKAIVFTTKVITVAVTVIVTLIAIGVRKGHSASIERKARINNTLSS